MHFERVHIFGGAGSGKTTLAQRYAKQHQFAHYELDEIYYSNVPTRSRRERVEREGFLSDIVASDQWVVDGIFWQPWVRPALERADKIIVLAVPESTRHLRVIKRHFRLLKGASPSDWPTFFPTLIELLKHNRAYNSGPLRETLELLAGYEAKVAVCESNDEAARALGLC
ncbi:MAG: hypothetical protein NXH85_05665 [Pseudomonadaceae bacterium]|nr:hypothetical protein [Pseudomonadaceae bacterium]